MRAHGTLVLYFLLDQWFWVQSSAQSSWWPYVAQLPHIKRIKCILLSTDFPPSFLRFVPSSPWPVHLTPELVMSFRLNFGPLPWFLPPSIPISPTFRSLALSAWGMRPKLLRYESWNHRILIMWQNVSTKFQGPPQEQDPQSPCPLGNTGKAVTKVTVNKIGVPKVKTWLSRGQAV